VHCRSLILTKLPFHIPMIFVMSASCCANLRWRSALKIWPDEILFQLEVEALGFWQPNHLLSCAIQLHMGVRVRARHPIMFLVCHTASTSAAFFLGRAALSPRRPSILVSPAHMHLYITSATASTATTAHSSLQACQGHLFTHAGLALPHSDCNSIREPL